MQIEFHFIQTMLSSYTEPSIYNQFTTELTPPLIFVSPAPVQCFSCATCRNRLMPGDRFHYINGTIFCEHDRPGAALLNSHLPPLQSNSVLTDQKVNKKRLLTGHMTPQGPSASAGMLRFGVNVNNKMCWFPPGWWQPQQDLSLVKGKMQQSGQKNMNTGRKQGWYYYKATAHYIVRVECLITAKY